MRNYLKVMRDERNLKQSDMAMKLKVSQPYYCDMESGYRQHNMAYSMMERLAAAFDVPVQTIIEAEKNHYEINKSGGAYSA